MKTGGGKRVTMGKGKDNPLWIPKVWSGPLAKLSPRLDPWFRQKGSSRT